MEDKFNEYVLTGDGVKISFKLPSGTNKTFIFCENASVKVCWFCHVLSGLNTT